MMKITSLFASQKPLLSSPEILLKYPTLPSVSQWAGHDTFTLKFGETKGQRRNREIQEAADRSESANNIKESNNRREEYDAAKNQAIDAAKKP